VNEQEDMDIVARVVRRYIRRSAWAALIADDLAQEGALALAKARRTFDPTVGVPWEGYAYRAAWLACAGYLVADSSPVTRRAAGAENRARRAPEEALAAYVDGLDVVETYEDAEWCASVRARLGLLADGDADVVGVLLEETTPAAVAAARGLPVARVYAAVATARRRATMDGELYALMRDKKGVTYSEAETA
jgi:DNA-directed RNA polymerase specialized sigma24 family protein